MSSDFDRRRALLTLALHGHFRYKHLERLTEEFGSLEEAFDAPAGDWQALDRKNSTQFERAAELRGSEEVDEVAEQIESGEINFLSYEDEAFPELLKTIPDRPLYLFYKGDPELLKRASVAVVGTRSSDGYGKRTSERIGRELAEAGVNVVSGMAHGIDGKAHEGALDGGGPTTAVLGTGIDQPYPASHRGLYDRIAEEGLVLSEYPPGMSGSRYTFPERNRLISGISLGAVIVQAPSDSGALITASHALEQGREVFAVPGLISNPKSGGCHDLIQEGAFLVQTPGDVLNYLGLSKGEDEDEDSDLQEKLDQLSDTEREVLETVSYQGTHINTITRKLDSTVDETSAHLMSLEVEGLVESLPGGFYQRVL